MEYLVSIKCSEIDLKTSKNKHNKDKNRVVSET